MFVCLLWCDTALTSSLASHSSIICAVSPLTCRLRMSCSSWLPWSASSALRASVSWRAFRAGSPWGGTFGCEAHWEVWCWSWPPSRTRVLNRPSPILPVRQQKLKSSHMLEGSSLLSNSLSLIFYTSASKCQSTPEYKKKKSSYRDDPMRAPLRSLVAFCRTKIASNGSALYTVAAQIHKLQAGLASHCNHLGA